MCPQSGTEVRSGLQYRRVLPGIRQRGVRQASPACSVCVGDSRASGNCIHPAGAYVGALLAEHRLESALNVGSSSPDPLLVVILGPTASGKTALSLVLAKEFDGEIVNCDSVAMYREF